MYVQVEFLDSNLVDQVVNLALKLICKEDARLDGALAETSGTGLFDAYVHSRAHTLARDLHQSELRQGKDVVAGAILLHVLAHALVEHLAVFGKVHVDEVYDDDTSHIPEPELACQFVGCAEVHFQYVRLLSFS